MIVKVIPFYFILFYFSIERVSWNSLLIKYCRIRISTSNILIIETNHLNSLYNCIRGQRLKEEVGGANLLSSSSGMKWSQRRNIILIDLVFASV